MDDPLTGNSAGCLTALTVTAGLVLCLRRSSFADSTGSSSLSAATAAVTGVLLPVRGVAADAAAAGVLSALPVRGPATGVLLPVRGVVAAAGVFSALAVRGVAADAEEAVCGGWELAIVVTVAEMDVVIDGTLSEERTSELEPWTVADGIG